MKNGVVIAIENGRGGWLDRIYRKYIRKVRWADFQLFSIWTEEEFCKIFGYVDIEYFGRHSEFFTKFPKICSRVQYFEQKIWPPDAEHCFVSSIVAQK